MKLAILSYKPFIQFGGQAAAWFDELKKAWDGCPATKPLIEAVNDALQKEFENGEARASGYFGYGIDIVSWLNGKRPTPTQDYLSSSAVSQPCIFLTQAANLLVADSNGLKTGELLRLAKGTTGHSQGIMTAVLFAMGLSGDKHISAACDIARWLFWQGIRMQESWPMYAVSQAVVKRAKEDGLGVPTPMAAVSGIVVRDLEKMVEEFNRSAGRQVDRSANGGINIALRNTYNRAVLSGPPESLILFNEYLNHKSTNDERRTTSYEFIPTSAPFHSPYMKKGLERTTADLKHLGIKFSSKSLKISVFATDSGKNLQKSSNLMQDLLEMMHIHPVDWVNVCSAIQSTNPTHIIDFGPGEAAAKLSGINCQGRGIGIISFSTEAGRHQLFSENPDDIKLGKDWREFRPKVFRRTTAKRGNELKLYNRYVEHTGYAPIFGAGMTPTTAETDIVIAAANAGYIVELAGGGQVTEEIFRQRLDEAVKKLKPGVGIIVNTLFLDPYLWNLHYNLIPQLKAEGYPIIGVTITAGIPEKEKAVEILETFNKAGIWCNALKPGTDAQIAQVLEIADELNVAAGFSPPKFLQISGDLKVATTRTPNPEPRTPLLMHVEGGLAGGHHSWEDLHGLILRNYAKIRQRENIILCVGGGIWNEEQAFKWLNGDWHGISELPPMPVDAVFLGTRLLAVKEAKTSPQVKKFLVEISGHDGWVKKGEVRGGVTSAESHLGADIYYAENSAAKASRLLDSLAGKKDEILSRRAEVIEAINKTCKPYFGDLEKMTYAEVLRRMIELMAPGGIAEHLPHDGDWYDVTFKMRVAEFVKRVEERFANFGWHGVVSDPPKADGGEARRKARSDRTRNLNIGDFDNPQKFVHEFLKKYPSAEETILHPEDVDYFIWLCKRPGKPVNFVPVIDEDVRRWFKSDSLWQAHDPRYSADAVFALPGPAAVQGIKKADEPVVGVLSGFEGYAAEKLDKGGKVYRSTGLQVNRSIGGPADLYTSLWGSKKKTKITIKIKKEDIRRYCAAVGERSKASTHGVDGKLAAPINMAFVFAWEPVTAVMWKELAGADMSKLVHLSNRIEARSTKHEARYLFEGDEIECIAKSGGVFATKSGTILSVVVDILRNGEKVIEMESRFFVKGYKMAVIPAKAGISLSSGDSRLRGNDGHEVPLKSPIELFSDSMRAPMDNKIYANASGDHNPLHINKNVATAAGFKDTIVHGMWTSSAALAKINAQVAADDPSRVKEWDVNFESPVFPEEELKISAYHVGNINGNMAVEVKVVNSAGTTVLQARAKIAPSRTAYIFTGQGSQEQGMGMDGYSRSAAARAIWDESDAYCRDALGFSILKVVRDNPVTMLVGKDTVRHPKGVLNLTQFTQVGLTVLAMAHVAELKEAGVYADDAVFCGHSLGEYAALSCSGIIPLKQVIKTVYNRGLTMQNFVSRDENGVSPYRMCVVRPNIIKMKHGELDDLINGIASRENGSLEIVNYNIEGEQYSVTGEKRLLAILEAELKRREKEVRATKPSIIFLEGIDVPFHSKVLRPGVSAFRKTLEATIPKDMDPALLVGRYIPNLNAKPFELTKEYIEDVYKLTDSSVLAHSLPFVRGGLGWGRGSTSHAPSFRQITGGQVQRRGELARTLLIELLAYQFASPVQWIDTQKALLNGNGALRIVEIGPQPVLANMARRTLAKQQKQIAEPAIMHVSADRKGVFYE